MARTGLGSGRECCVRQKIAVPARLNDTMTNSPEISITPQIQATADVACAACRM